MFIKQEHFVQIMCKQSLNNFLNNVWQSSAIFGRFATISMFFKSSEALNLKLVKLVKLI